MIGWGWACSCGALDFGPYPDRPAAEFGFWWHRMRETHGAAAPKLN